MEGRGAIQCLRRYHAGESREADKSYPVGSLIVTNILGVGAYLFVKSESPVGELALLIVENRPRTER